MTGWNPRQISIRGDNELRQSLCPDRRRRRRLRQRPADPGGETKYGISHRAHPDVDIKSLTLDQARTSIGATIGSLQAATVCRSASASGVRCAVHHGVKTATSCCSDALKVADDGEFGPVTRGTLTARDTNETADLLMAQRMLYLMTCSAWPTYKLGWANGVLALRGLHESTTTSGPLVDLIGKISDKIWRSCREDRRANRAAENAAGGNSRFWKNSGQSDNAQTEINKIEAASDNKFKSCWRPALGWICVSGFRISVTGSPFLIGFGYSAFPSWT